MWDLTDIGRVKGPSQQPWRYKALDSESIAINAVQRRRRYAVLARLSGRRPYRCLVACCRGRSMSVSPKGAVTTVQGFAKPASFARARLNWLFEAQHVEGWNEISRLIKVLTKSGKFAETRNSRQSIRRSRSIPTSCRGRGKDCWRSAQKFNKLAQNRCAVLSNCGARARALHGEVTHTQRSRTQGTRDPALIRQARRTFFLALFLLHPPSTSTHTSTT